MGLIGVIGVVRVCGGNWPRPRTSVACALGRKVELVDIDASVPHPCCLPRECLDGLVKACIECPPPPQYNSMLQKALKKGWAPHLQAAIFASRAPCSIELSLASWPREGTSQTAMAQENMTH